MSSVSTPKLLLAAALCLFTFRAAAVSNDLPNRHELKRADLSGAAAMEVISAWFVGRGDLDHVEPF